MQEPVQVKRHQPMGIGPGLIGNLQRCAPVRQPGGLTVLDGVGDELERRPTFWDGHVFEVHLGAVHHPEVIRMGGAEPDVSGPHHFVAGERVGPGRSQGRPTTVEQLRKALGGDGGQQGLLAGEVAVGRGSGHPQSLGDSPQGEPLRTSPIDDLERGGHEIMAEVAVVIARLYARPRPCHGGAILSRVLGRGM